jgi:hypothetical protein
MLETNCRDSLKRFLETFAGKSVQIFWAVAKNESIDLDFKVSVLKYNISLDRKIATLFFKIITYDITL